ncbi:MAG TPA: MBL fold metallo-hydrolase [Blastocatellia bacterium]
MNRDAANGIGRSNAIALIFSILALLTMAQATKATTPPSVAKVRDAGATSAADETECEKAGPKGCLMLSIGAMGGLERLEGIKSLHIRSIGHTLLTEQSYRQEPFITSYDQDTETVDLAGSRVYRETHLTWPESDPGQSDVDQTIIGGPAGAVYHSVQGDSPAPASVVASIQRELALGPARLLVTGLHASDLHFEASQDIRSTRHSVMAFTWDSIPVRIMINRFNYLPDAVETTQQFLDFWYYWGDVTSRLYFEDMQLDHGIVYPTNMVEERNGILWRSTQLLNVDFNVAIDEGKFKIDSGLAARGLQSKGWEAPFKPGPSRELAPGITFIPGSWNSTIIKQSDGIVVLEAPISGIYTQGVIDEARRRYPSLPIKAVLSTSDSWPHVGGVRQCVAGELPVYILDVNQPLLDRFVNAAHRIRPDALAENPKKPKWSVVSGKMVIGSGDNRVEIYPLRGASTERQYMVYFPAHRLLYASDTLVLNDDGSLYMPELMHEVVQAVERAGITVDRVYAMHQPPVPWSQAADLVHKAQSPLATDAIAASAGAAEGDHKTNAASQAALKPEIEVFKPLIGNWTCSGEFNSNHAPISSTISFEPQLDGAWLEVKHKDEPPNRYISQEMWGYDKDGKVFVAVIHDNFGGVRLFSSPGWSGDALTWTGDTLMAGQKLAQRFIYEKAISGNIVVRWQVNKQGNWIEGDHLTCSKQ